MRIAAVESIRVRLPLKPERRMISALGRHEVSSFVLVKVTADNGLVGIGEATATANWSGETVWGASAIIDHMLGPVVIGCDPADVAEIDRRMDSIALYNWFAKSAIEMACWDLVGKEAQKPVYELLGGACRPLRIMNRFSIGAYPPEVAAQRAAERVAVGFSTIKVKVGTDPEVDIARVKAVREAIGPDISLMVDANGGWNEAQAFWSLERLLDLNLTLVEQPLQRGDYSGLRRLREQLGCRILADESCFNEIEAQELIEQGCCDVISLYPGKQGGLRKARKIADLAAAANISCSIGSNLEWDVGAATMLHFIVSTPNMQIEKYPGDCLGPFYHEVSIARNPLQIEGPYTTLHDGPGLGIDVDWETVERHRLP